MKKLVIKSILLVLYCANSLATNLVQATEIKEQQLDQERNRPVFKQQYLNYKSAQLLARNGKAASSRFSPRRSKLGSIIVEFDVGKDGKVRDIEIAQNYWMDHVGVANIIEKVAQAKYKPGTNLKGKAVKVKSYSHRSVWALREVTKSYVKKTVPRFYRKIKLLKKSASQGDYYAKYQLAMYALVYPSLGMDKTIYLDYITQSAKAGVIEAKVEYAQLLLQGKLLKKDHPQAIKLLFSAAQSGYARAQYKLARQFLSGGVLIKDEQKAQFWLTQAVAQQEPYAKYWLARLSLIGKNKQLRNPELAITLLNDIEQQQKNNPNWYYFSAVAQKQLGNNKQGKLLLEGGLELAQSYQWQVSKFHQLARKLI